MIRLPLTNIELSRRDLTDYERRKRTGKENREIDLPSTRFFPIVPNYPPRSEELCRNNLDIIEQQYGGPRSAADRYAQLTSPLSPPFQVDTVTQDYRSVSSENLSPGNETRISDETDEQEYVQVSLDASPEHTSLHAEQEHPQQHQHQHCQPVLPSKDDFHYGGFVESSERRTGEDSNRFSSPFIPDEISTPTNLQLPPQRIGSRALPRSPLFISQNASSSPERRPGFALTPRVTSRVATHNAPGIIFSQPPRRPIRRSPRHHRHQTNSFSFDSTERSSAAYEQQRVSSSSTTQSRPSISDEISLHDELRDSSLQSSRVASGTSEISQAPHYNRTTSNQDAITRFNDMSREFIFSSPQLPLPRPFSSVSRSPSPESPQSPTASPVRSHSSTAANVVQEGSSSRSPSPNTMLKSDINSSPPVRTGFSPMSLLRQAQRAISTHRARSPLHRDQIPQDAQDNHAATGSASSTSTPHQSQSSQRRQTSPRTQSQVYDVYNDDMPRAIQPQTPAHLPESRHQSRYHPSYTAPVTRAAARRSREHGRGGNAAEANSPVPDQRSGFRSTWRSFRTRRVASPIGMQQDGFRGLYGGRENGDEEQNWVEGVRFNNAETRLWGARDARNDDGGLRETPEPEDWRVGRRS